MVALKQGPDDSLVPTGANEVLVLMGVDDVLVELDDVLLELDKALVEVDRVKVLVLKVDDGASDTEDVVEEDLLPLPLLPLPLPLPLLPLPLPLPLPLLPLPLPLPLLPLSFLANGLAAAHAPKRAAANRNGRTIVVSSVNGIGV
jgi:hypothetical protein